MIFAFAFTVFIGICALAMIGLEESHYRVNLLLQELDESRQAEIATAGQAAGQSKAPVLMFVPKPPQNALSELSFTRSLLALSKVDSLVPCDSPELVRALSSSSALVHPDQSKNPVQVL
jgi:hypothetical protein